MLSFIILAKRVQQKPDERQTLKIQPREKTRPKPKKTTNLANNPKNNKHERTNGDPPLPETHARATVQPSSPNHETRRLKRQILRLFSPETTHLSMLELKNKILLCEIKRFRDDLISIIAVGLTTASYNLHRTKSLSNSLPKHRFERGYCDTQLPTIS